MITEYLQGVFLIFAAEMGDKTQILAMMFATKYKTRKVLLGILIGSFLNHGLAVLFGNFLGNVIPIYMLQIIAGVAFVFFALWTLMAKEDDDVLKEAVKLKNPVFVVAMAFFIGELGDKTQLTAITLSVDALFPIVILMGTITGMILTSSLGIYVGTKVGDKIPEVLIKIGSSGIFLTFGILKLVQSTPRSWVNVYTMSLFTMVISLTVALLLKTLFKAHQEGQLTSYGRAAKALYEHANHMEASMTTLCRGIEHCGSCQGQTCAVGFIKAIVKDIKSGQLDQDAQKMFQHIRYYDGKFDQAKLTHGLKVNMAYMVTLEKDNPGYNEVDLIRQVIEVLLIGTTLPYHQQLEAYKKSLEVYHIQL